MTSVEDSLVCRDDGLILRFTPPFDRMNLDPGYIKGHLPGVYENGGQYTQAAIRSILAFAALGDRDEAGKTLHDLESNQACQRLLPEVALAGMKRDVTTRPLQSLPHSHTQISHRP